MDTPDPITPCLRRPPLGVDATVARGRPPITRGLDERAPGDLRDAVAILSEQMHLAVARRRMSQPGTESHRRADERVAYLVELFGRLRRRMAIPDEVWQLRPGHPIDGGGANAGVSRAHLVVGS